jgi:arylsulfatase A
MGWRISFMPACVLALLLAGQAAAGQESAGQASSGKPARPPNFVIVFLDDSGWGDFSPFARTPYPTPGVDRLAREGCCFENFYVPQGVCSASRAALLSGCYPERTRIFGAIAPRTRGLDPRFATMGEVLKARGYATAVFGKWHIGDQPETRPPARGFDESCGLMVSNDMWDRHPENPKFWGKHPLQYWEDGRVTIDGVTEEHQTHLTEWYTKRAVDFIRRRREGPFLLYVPHSMPHVPLFCGKEYLGKSGAGLYGDVMMEIDASVGSILAALDEAGVADDTVVILTSDNGPWISYGNHAGKTPFREAKGTGFDGGIRSACIIRYPGRIAAGARSRKAFCSIDILPTLCRLAGSQLPANPIDGKDVWDLIAGKEGARNPHEYYPFTTGNAFEGVISGDGRWKLHLPHEYRTLAEPGRDGRPGKYRTGRIGLSLFDMAEDPFETRNVAVEHPEIAGRLKALAEGHKARFFREIPAQARPVFNLLRAARRGDLEGLKTVFSQRMRGQLDGEGWDKVLARYREAFKKEFGDYRPGEFVFQFTGGEEKGTVEISRKGKKLPGLQVIKEGADWKIDEK